MPFRYAGFALLAALGWAPAVAAQAMSHRGDQPIAKGSLGARDRSRQHRVSLDPGPVGWEFVLETDNPTAADLDLYVYDGLEIGSRTRPLCSSEGIDAVEICRVVPAPRGPVMVEVVPNGGDGSTTYLLSRRALQGPRMGNTVAVAGDAHRLDPGTWTVVDPRGKKSPLPESGLGDLRLYQLPPSGVVAVSSNDPASFASLRVFRQDGSELPDSLTRGVYLERSLREAGFALIAPPGQGTRLAAPYAVGVFPEGAPIPVPTSVDEWTGSGTGERAFLLQLHAGESAIVKLEGTGGNLTLIDAENHPVPVSALFGSAQQIAWIGDPVGASKQLLGPVGRDRQLTVRIKQGEAIGYNRARGWTVHVHTLRAEPNYLLRVAVEDADTWRDWWSSPIATRSDSTGRDGTRIIAIQPPFNLERASPNQSAQLAIRQTAIPAMYFARLQGSRGLHLAVCTADGQVLDVGGSSPIRWEWSPGLGQLFLVVFPNPQEPAQAGGPFRLELTRSLISGAKP